jgi:hypothetical protein
MIPFDLVMVSLMVTYAVMTVMMMMMMMVVVVVLISDIATDHQ